MVLKQQKMHFSSFFFLFFFFASLFFFSPVFLCPSVFKFGRIMSQIRNYCISAMSPEKSNIALYPFPSYFVDEKDVKYHAAKKDFFFFFSLPNPFSTLPLFKEIVLWEPQNVPNVIRFKLPLQRMHQNMFQRNAFFFFFFPKVKKI